MRRYSREVSLKGRRERDSRHGGGLHKFGGCNWRPNTFTIQIMEIPRVYVSSGRRSCRRVYVEHERIYSSEPIPLAPQFAPPFFRSNALQFTSAIGRVLSLSLSLCFTLLFARMDEIEKGRKGEKTSPSPFLQNHATPVVKHDKRISRFSRRF